MSIICSQTFPYGINLPAADNRGTLSVYPVSLPYPCVYPPVGDTPTHTGRLPITESVSSTIPTGDICLQIECAVCPVFEDTPHHVDQWLSDGVWVFSVTPSAVPVA